MSRVTTISEWRTWSIGNEEPLARLTEGFELDAGAFACIAAPATCIPQNSVPIIMAVSRGERDT
jgi:hypothetical protein